MSLVNLPLVFLERPASTAVAQRWLLVLMHGVGSNERDAFTLVERIPDCFHVLCVRAPVNEGPNAWRWFDFTLAADGSRTIDQAQEEAGRRQLARLVEQASAQLCIDADSVVLGGINQGGIMALSLLLTRPELVRAAMVLHSRLLPEVMPLIAPPEQLRGRQLWLSYTTGDTFNPLKYAHQIRTEMRKLPVVSRYAEFAGTQELGEAEVFEALEWLSTLASMG